MIFSYAKKIYNTTNSLKEMDNNRVKHSNVKHVLTVHSEYSRNIAMIIKQKKKLYKIYSANNPLNLYTVSAIFWAQEDNIR